jgi:hypothetical protein
MRRVHPQPVRQLGVVTGLVGAAGGPGGFVPLLIMGRVYASGRRGERPARRRTGRFLRRRPAPDQPRLPAALPPLPRPTGSMRLDPDGRVWYRLHPERVALVIGEEDQHWK